MPKSNSLYPEIKITRIKNPNRFYAVPLLGFFVKLFLLIPVGIELIVLRIFVFFVSIFNAINIFTTGNYLKFAYEMNIGLMRLEAKTNYYAFGLTDTYPGFSLEMGKGTTLDMPMPKNPSRVFATPILGVFFRFIMLIPYLLYKHIIGMAAFIAIFISWVFVLFKGVYPETTFEIMRDNIRLEQGVNAYFWGLSDTYPSFWISMNHQALKLILIGAATILSLLSWHGNVSRPERPTTNQQYYQYQVTPTPSSYEGLTPTSAPYTY